MQKGRYIDGFSVALITLTDRMEAAVKVERMEEENTLEVQSLVSNAIWVSIGFRVWVLQAPRT